MENLFKKTIVFGIGTFLLYVVLYTFFDKFIAHWMHIQYSSTSIFQYGKFISSLAKASYIELALSICYIIILLCDPDIKKQWTKRLAYVCISVSVAMIISDGIKYFLGRYRPIMLFEHNLYGLRFFSSEWALNSTPSGHTVRAFSLLTAASLLYKRFTLIFISVAVLIGASRVVITDHYPSDVVFGAFIGIIVATWTYKHFIITNEKCEEKS